jgi:hypothetical protein
MSSKTTHNIGYPPAGTTEETMKLVYLKIAVQAQIPLRSPAGG